MQRIWMEDLAWDDKVPHDLASEWQRYKATLHQMEDVYIPRWAGSTSTDIVEFHGFSDASERAYAAVIYSRILHANGGVTVRLLAAKTKVAPIKSQKLTIPRLELLGAHILAVLMHKVKTAMEFNDNKTYYWTDSTAVLGWIHGNPSNWQTFVANRVTAIQKLSQPQQWYHVKGCENPADTPSRGVDPDQLKSDLVWWNGPTWMLKREIDIATISVFQTELEKKKIIMGHVCGKISMDLNISERYSTLTRLKRITATMLRFIRNCKNSSNKLTAELTAKELANAERILIRIEQQTHFGDEWRALVDKKPVNKSSRLITLTPFIDDNQLIRVGGRLEKSSITYDQKHPVVLPSKGTLTALFVNDTHLATLHGGNALTLTILRQRFWILNGANTVRFVLHKCVKCHRFKANPGQQVMGNLPEARITPSKPFSHSGVDYAGPYSIKMSGGRGCKTYKGYIALFVCMATKAVHLELVGDLTAEAFVAAFKRFIARRGLITDLYSDNGTNFVLANKLINSEAAHAKRKNDQIVSMVASQNINWHFIPPSAPNFGGLWEAGVKSVKYHVKRTIGEATLSYEEFLTLLTQIEACLNSRPICPVSNDPTDLEVLTPGHFLVGQALKAVPESALLNKNENHLNRWQVLQKMSQHFWDKWQKEYLVRLQQRKKWTTESPNLKVGQLVLIMDDNQAPANWLLGRIIQTHPGSDGMVRVATIKTKNSTLKRPINKVSPLPIEIADDKMNEMVKMQLETVQDNSSKIVGCFVQMETGAKPQKRKHEPKDIITSTKRRQPTLFSTIMMMLVFLTGTWAAPQYPDSIQISEFNKSAGIYYENIGNLNLIADEWKIIVFLELRTYWSHLYALNRHITNIEQRCEQHAFTTNRGLCTDLAKQFKRQLRNIENKNLIMLGSQSQSLSRQRRGMINAIGGIANTLFGVLDQQFAEKYETEIEKLRSNENYLMELLRNQTSIEESTVNLFKGSEEETRNHISAMEKYLGAFSNKTNQILTEHEEKLTLFGLATNALMLIWDFEQTQNALYDALTDMHHGKINPIILTPEQLAKQIELIKSKISRDLMIKSENLAQLYHTMAVQASLTRDRILLVISIPLKINEHYQLFRLIPIPTHRSSNEDISIQPEFEYLAASLDRNTFYVMHQSELNACDKLDSTYSCNQNAAIISVNQESGNKCEINMFMGIQHLHKTLQNQIDDAAAGSNMGEIKNDKQLVFLARSNI